jgi:hypothetical protein
MESITVRRTSIVSASTHGPRGRGLASSCGSHETRSSDDSRAQGALRRRQTVANVVTICIAWSCITCGGSSTSLPTAPSPPTVTPPAPSLANVSGTVWIHDAAGVRPYTGAGVSVWFQTSRQGGGLPTAVADSNGVYVLRAEVGSLLRMNVLGSAYQPCAATVEVIGDVTRDVHTVSDREQLGGRLPQQLLSQSPTLSGVVFELTSEARNVLSDARLDLVTADGGEIGMATTLTGSDGRYVLCGLERDSSAYLYVSKSGYPQFGTAVALTGNATTFDIQLQRR